MTDAQGGLTVEPGQRYRSTRSGSGRIWEVSRAALFLTDEWQMLPLGDDVRPAQTGNVMNGGVRRIHVSGARLLDPRYWERVE